MLLFYPPAQHGLMVFELLEYVLMLQSKEELILLIVSACSEWMATSTKQ